MRKGCVGFILFLIVFMHPFFLLSDARTKLPFECGAVAYFPKFSKNYADFLYLLRTMYGTKASQSLLVSWQRQISTLCKKTLSKCPLFLSMADGDGALGFWGWKHRKFAIVIKAVSSKESIAALENILRALSGYKEKPHVFKFNRIVVTGFGSSHSYHSLHYYYKNGYFVIANSRQAVFDTFVASAVRKRSFIVRSRLIPGMQGLKNPFLFYFTGRALHHLVWARLRFYDFFQENRVAPHLRYGTIIVSNSKKLNISVRLNFFSRYMTRRFLLSGLALAGKRVHLLPKLQDRFVLRASLSVASYPLWRILYSAAADGKAQTRRIWRFVWFYFFKQLKPQVGYYIFQKSNKVYYSLFAFRLKYPLLSRSALILFARAKKTTLKDDIVLYEMPVRSQLPFMKKRIFWYMRKKRVLVSSIPLSSELLRAFIVNREKRSRHGAIFLQIQPLLLQKALESASIRENFLYLLAHTLSGAKTVSFDYTVDLPGSTVVVKIGLKAN